LPVGIRKRSATTEAEIKKSKQLQFCYVNLKKTKLDSIFGPLTFLIL
jgi:hypothetical protein